MQKHNCLKKLPSKKPRINCLLNMFCITRQMCYILGQILFQARGGWIMMKTGLVKIYRHFGSSQATRAMSCQVLPWYIVTLMYTDKIFLYTHFLIIYSQNILSWYIATLMYTVCITDKIYMFLMICFSMIYCYFKTKCTFTTWTSSQSSVAAIANI